MTEGEAYLAQARSDLRIFNTLLLLQKTDISIEPCHTLHYLQMACEKLAKALFFAEDLQVPRSHIAISRISQMLSRREYADKLGFQNRHQAFDIFLKKAKVFFVAIERLCPAVAESQRYARYLPNIEYPWRLQGGTEWQAPCEHQFDLERDIRVCAQTKQILEFLKLLSERFYEIF